MADREDEWLDILTNLIQINSENPPGDTTEIAEYVTGIFDERGIEYEVIAPQEDMPNVLAHFEGDVGDPEDGHHLTFNGHLDTFEATGGDRWDYDPFGGEIVDGKVYGRGAADMHGGFTASLAAFIYLFENKDTLPGKVTFAAVSDEETGGKWGAEYLVENHPEYNGDVVLNGEPSTNDMIRFGERGPIWLEIAVRGQAAHISTLDEKVSAVEILADIVHDLTRSTDLETRYDIPKKAESAIRNAEDVMDEALGEGATERVLKPDRNFGIIEGGEKANLVAEHARAELDVRMPVGASTDDAREWVEDAVSDYPGEIEVSTLLQQDPTWSDYEHPIFQHLRDAAGQVRGKKPEFSCSLGGSDCRFYRIKDIPCAVYGPTPYNIGSENEHIYIDDFTEIVQAQTMAAAAFLQDV
jgi:succinyl-diaminopimelate desuccinylase